MKEFKLIVAGGRSFNDGDLLSKVIMDLANDVYATLAISLVCGMAKGADTLGYLFAVKNDVRRYCFPADWDKYGRRAGMLRNKEMGVFADGLLAFYNGSNGTGQMIKYMGSLNKPVHIVLYGEMNESYRPDKPSIWGANGQVLLHDQ